MAWKHFTFTGQDKIPQMILKHVSWKEITEITWLHIYPIYSRLQHQTNLRNKHHIKPNRPLWTTNNRKKSNTKHKHQTKIHKCKYNIFKPNITTIPSRWKNRAINPDNKTIQRKNGSVQNCHDKLYSNSLILI